MKNLDLVLVLILAAGAGAVFFSTDFTRNAADPNAGASPLDADYDYYIQDMLTTRFGSEGQALSRLRAARVTHYPDGDRAELLAPRFQSYTDSDSWQVSADTGTLMPDPARAAEERLDLSGNVALHKPLEAGNFIDINTHELTVFVDTEEVFSEAPVTLRTRNMRQEATGMRALLAQDHLQLDNGNGTYDPVPNP